jgi:hypothetical protein
MNNQKAIIAMLAIMSIAALAGVFTVQVADAQIPFLDVGADGVRFQTEEFGLSATPSGVQIVPPRPLPEERLEVIELPLTE